MNWQADEGTRKGNETAHDAMFPFDWSPKQPSIRLTGIRDPLALIACFLNADWLLSMPHKLQVQLTTAGSINSSRCLSYLYTTQYTILWWCTQ